MQGFVGNFKELIGEHVGENFLILGASYTAKEYKAQILDFVQKNKCVIIGVNNVSEILIPDYHLWLNNKRLNTFGATISNKSKVIIGDSIIPKNIPNIDYHKVYYTDWAFQGLIEKPETSCGIISGSFRTGGNLAIYLSYLMGAINIYCAGFEAYSFPRKGNQHCYGEGFTDSDNIELEEKKDKIILGCLREINKVAPFKIITPTTFTEFYEGLL